MPSGSLWGKLMLKILLKKSWGCLRREHLAGNECGKNSSWLCAVALETGTASDESLTTALDCLE